MIPFHYFKKNIMEIVRYPNKILRAKSKEISDFESPDIKKLIAEMIPTMKNANGIGLAAPQIGKNIRLTVIETKNGPLPLINPKIIKKSFKKEISEEGCLSLPGVFGTVKRHKKIKFKALTPEGQEMIYDAEGLFARVVQHEIDHLDGILFIDKAIEITEGKIKDEAK